MKTIRPGQLVYWRGNAFIVLELKGLKEVLLRPVGDGETSIALASDCSSTPMQEKASTHYHLLAKEEEWDIAWERFETIRPLLDMPNRSANDVQQHAHAIGRGVATLYRWIQRFEETGLVSSLMRKPRKDKGIFRLDEDVERVMKTVINREYKRPERPMVAKVFDDIKNACRLEDLEPPHKNTVYARIAQLDDKEVTEARFGRKVAKQKYQPVLGKFPNADVPLAVVQIDHTPFDVIIVDSVDRLPIGKPYLTLAIDVATKVILGFRITLDPPGALSAGLCIAHAVCRKEYWLAIRNIDAEWPMYGKPQKIHVDNAREFRGSMLKRGCDEHNIMLEWRPKGQPNYGPHIERAFRTFLTEIHSLPGTTFSNVKEKMDYDSEGKACFTLEELEQWFTVFIVYVYLNKAHSGISNYAPINRYFQLVHGTNELPGIGLPEAIADEEKFRLDFTPYVTRAITREGVKIDYIQYYSDVLRKWIGKKDEEDPSKSRQFIFARDPRDISRIYFLDPDTAQYCAIPYRNNRHPPISLWELNAAVARIAQDPYAAINEDAIFKGIEIMRQIERESIEKTRLANQQRSKEKRKRRQAERRRTNDLERMRAENISLERSIQESPAPEVDDSPIEPFNDIDIL